MCVCCDHLVINCLWRHFPVATPCDCKPNYHFDSSSSGADEDRCRLLRIVAMQPNHNELFHVACLVRLTSATDVSPAIMADRLNYANFKIKILGK